MKIESLEGHLNKGLKSGQRYLTFGQLMDFFLKHKNPTSKKARDNFDVVKALLSVPGNAKKDKEFNHQRDQFIRNFGEAIFDKLVLYLIDSNRIDFSTGVIEAKLKKALSWSFVLMVVLNENLSRDFESKIKFTIDKKNELTIVGT